MMNKTKKALLGTALAGALVVGASAGTYAWFNAEVKVSGDIQNYTLELNDTTQDAITLFGNEGIKLAPSRTAGPETFDIKNTGELDQVIRMGADFTLTGPNGPYVTNVDGSVYKITGSAQLLLNGNPVGGALPFNTTAAQIDTLFAGDTWFPSEDGKFWNGTQLVLPSGYGVRVTLNVKLDEDAGNKYQAATLFGELEVDGKQTDEGSEFND
jgi:spore coat-associated protein N